MRPTCIQDVRLIWHITFTSTYFFLLFLQLSSKWTLNSQMAQMQGSVLVLQLDSVSLKCVISHVFQLKLTNMTHNAKRSQTGSRKWLQGIGSSLGKDGSRKYCYKGLFMRKWISNSRTEEVQIKCYAVHENILQTFFFFKSVYWKRNECDWCRALQIYLYDLLRDKNVFDFNQIWLHHRLITDICFLFILFYFFKCLIWCNLSLNFRFMKFNNRILRRILLRDTRVESSIVALYKKMELQNAMEVLDSISGDLSAAPSIISLQ